MSTELATRQPTGLKDLELIAAKASASGFFGMTKDQVFTLCLVAESEGLHPIAALRRFHVIEGKPSMRADAMQAEFQRLGGRIQWIRSDAEVCEAVFYHPEYAKDGFPVKVTLKELQEAGLTETYDHKTGKRFTKKNWKTFPRQMLRARAISEGVRAVNPSIVVGIYTPEEVSDFEPAKATARVIDTAPEPYKQTALQAQKVVEAQARVPEPYEESFPEMVRKDDGKLVPADAVRDALGEVERVTAPAPADVEQPKRLEVEAFLLEVVKNTNEQWLDWQKREGVEKPRPLCTVFDLENHAANHLIERGMPAGKIQGPTGKVSRPKLMGVLETCWKRSESEFTGLILGHIRAELSRKAAELGILDPNEADAEEVEVEEVA